MGMTRETRTISYLTLFSGVANFERKKDPEDSDSHQILGVLKEQRVWSWPEAIKINFGSF